MPFAHECSVRRIRGLEREAHVVCAERAGNDARDACRNPLRGCAARVLGLPGDFDGVAQARSCARPVGATAGVRDVDADGVNAASPGEHSAVHDSDQERRVSTAARTDRRAGAASHSCEGASSQLTRASSMRRICAIACQAPAPSNQRRWASSGIRASWLRRRTKLQSLALSTLALTRERGEPIDDLDDVECGWSIRRAGVLVHGHSLSAGTRRNSTPGCAQLPGVTSRSASRKRERRSRSAGSRISAGTMGSQKLKRR